MPLLAPFAPLRWMCSYRLPLVDGTTPAMRASGSSAMRSARPNALNTVSTMWCAFLAGNAIHMHGDQCVVDETLEEFVHQIDIKLADPGARKRHPILKPRATGQIDDHARQGLVERHVGVAVAADALLVASRLGKGLAEGDADVLDRVVRVDVQIALGADVEVDQAMARDLVEHVLEKRNPGLERRAPPVPSRFTLTVIWVSLVLRVTLGAACHGVIQLGMTR